MKSGKLFITPYGDEIRIVYTKKLEEAKDYIRKNKPKEFNDDFETIERTYANTGSCYYSYEDLHFVFFLNKPKDVESFSVIVHECVHVANRILYRRGLHLTPDSEEAYTYLVQFLFKEICKFLRAK